MAHVYKAKEYAVLKVGGIPIELSGDVRFVSGTDLIDAGIDIDLHYFEELIDGEWVSLATLKEYRAI